MGTQWRNPTGANYDPQTPDNEGTQLARNAEGPPHEVTLTPFFLSKYEMTQAQWQRFTEETPSLYNPESDPSLTFLHPVEHRAGGLAVDGLQADAFCGSGDHAHEGDYTARRHL